MTGLTNVLKPIKATTETALQRAILGNGYSILGSRTRVEWLDIELPVEDNRFPRRHCIDLIGRAGDRYVLCELKFGKDSSTDRPEHAAEELMEYYDLIKANWSALDRGKCRHPDGKPFTWEDVARGPVLLVVAANASYWAYWLGRRKVDVPRTGEIGFCSIDLPVDTFRKQKGNRELYLPTIEIVNWDIL